MSELKTPITYEGFIESSLMNGEGKITIDKDGVVCESIFDQAVVAYSDVESISFEDYILHIKTSPGDGVAGGNSSFGEHLRISRMGQQTEWCHRQVVEVYNAKVLDVFGVEESSVMTGKGNFAYEDRSVAKIAGCAPLQASGSVALQLFKDCLCVMSSGKFARRIPFVFISGMKKADYALNISLNTGESYTFSMLGYDLDPIEKKITDSVLDLREKGKEFIESLEAGLEFADIAKAARLLPEGIAVQLGLLPPALSAALEKEAQASKMGSVYNHLKAIGDASQMALGIKATPVEEDGEGTEDMAAALGGQAMGGMPAGLNLPGAEGPGEIHEDGEDAEAAEEMPKWIIWAAIPSVDSQYAVVEFAFPNEDAATYIFKTGGDFKTFLPILNRAMEATGLQRDVFSLTDDKLSAEQRMLIERTPALALLRALFAGKAIHRSPDSWKRSVEWIIAQG